MTGAARGIGKAIAAELVGRGYSVWVTDVDESAAQETAAEIGAVGGFALDVTDPDANRAAAARAAATAPLGAWVCNAGVLFEGNLTDLSEEQVRLQMEVNVLGAAWGARAAAEAFRGQSAKGGDLAIVASLSSHAPVPGLSAYAASKAAALSLATSLASELRGDKIRVHAICPDGVATDMVAQMAPQGEARKALAGGVMLTPQVVARELVDMFGTRRVYKTLPAWRGVLARTIAAAPGPLAPADRLSRRVGARRLKKAAKKSR